MRSKGDDLWSEMTLGIRWGAHSKSLVFITPVCYHLLLFGKSVLRFWAPLLPLSFLNPLFIWLCWVLQCVGSLFHWHLGSSSCISWTLELVGLVAPWHVDLSPLIRDRTCIGKWIHNHWTTREVPLNSIPLTWVFWHDSGSVWRLYPICWGLVFLLKHTGISV